MFGITPEGYRRRVRGRVRQGRRERYFITTATSFRRGTVIPPNEAGSVQRFGFPATIATLAICIAACGDPFGSVCTTSVEPGIVILVRDGTTGANITDGASGTVTDGGYTDTFRPYQLAPSGAPLTVRAADERPGRYGVFVVHPGYQPVSLTAVTVPAGQCHVATESLTITMAP